MMNTAERLLVLALAIAILGFLAWALLKAAGG